VRSAAAGSATVAVSVPVSVVAEPVVVVAEPVVAEPVVVEPVVVEPACEGPAGFSFGATAGAALAATAAPAPATAAPAATVVYRPDFFSAAGGADFCAAGGADATAGPGAGRGDSVFARSRCPFRAASGSADVEDGPGFFSAGTAAGAALAAAAAPAPAATAPATGPLVPRDFSWVAPGADASDEPSRDDPVSRPPSAGPSACSVGAPGRCTAGVPVRTVSGSVGALRAAGEPERETGDGAPGTVSRSAGDVSSFGAARDDATAPPAAAAPKAAAPAAAVAAPVAEP
jgi:hypothetical protein